MALATVARKHRVDTIFHLAALGSEHFDCPLKKDTRLDMMYMPDAVNAAITSMEANGAQLIHRNGYNVPAMSLAPQDIAAEIKKPVPELTVDYRVDSVRQAIAAARHLGLRP
jgi:hypothetical protein